MVNNIKGRPPTSGRLAPLGQRWCPRCEKMKEVEAFKGNDGYCKVCRKEYTKEYRAKKRGWKNRITIMGIDADFQCNHCGNPFGIITDKELEQGEYECPHCETIWRGRIEVRLTST